MKTLQKIYIPMVLGLFLSFAVQAGQELPVPGGEVGKAWAVDLGSAIPETGDYSILSGPAWATITEDGLLQGTPTMSGENRWEIRIDAGGGFPSDYVVVAEFYAR